MDSPPPEIQQASSELKDTPQTPLQNLKPSLVTLSDICSPIPFTNEKYTQTFELLFDANHCSINPTFKKGVPVEDKKGSKSCDENGLSILSPTVDNIEQVAAKTRPFNMNPKVHLKRLIGRSSHPRPFIPLSPIHILPIVKKN
jgi:hypothetical protein